MIFHSCVYRTSYFLHAKNTIINLKIKIQIIYVWERQHEIVKTLKCIHYFWFFYWNSFLIHQKCARNCLHVGNTWRSRKWTHSVINGVTSITTSRSWLCVCLWGHVLRGWSQRCGPSLTIGVMTLKGGEENSFRNVCWIMVIRWYGIFAQ